MQKNFAHIHIFPFDAALQNALLVWQPDVVFPVAHAEESGALQALLDSMRLVYVGGAAGSALRDKAAANRSVSEWLANRPGLQADFGQCVVPAFITLQRGDDIPMAVLDFCNRLPTGGRVIVVKLAHAGSGCGVSFFTSPKYPQASRAEVIAGINGPIWRARLDHIVECVEQFFAADSGGVLLQSGVAGTYISVGVLENPDPKALSVVEVVPAAGTMYPAVIGSEYFIPARLPQHWLELAQAIAVGLHLELGCLDYSRVKLIAEQVDALSLPTGLSFIGIHERPVLSNGSLFAIAAQADSLSFPELVKNLVLNAWSRTPAGSRHFGAQKLRPMGTSDSEQRSPAYTYPAYKL